MNRQTRMNGVRIQGASVLCALLLITGTCDGPLKSEPLGSGPPPAEQLPDGRVPVSFWLDASNPTIARDTVQQFHATATFADGDIDDVTKFVSWSARDVISATQIATVDSRGRALGRNPGQAIITATLNGQSVSTVLTVDLATLTSLALSPSSPTIAKGTSLTFTATGTFSDGSTQDLTSSASWGVTDVAPAVNIAFIDDQGTALGSSEGQAIVIASVLGESASTTLTVTAATVTSLAITPSTPTIVKGSRQQFLATAMFSDGSSQDVTSLASWGVAAIAPAAHVASINSRGLAVGTGAGSATISASLGGKNASATLTVVELTLASLALSPGNPTIIKGGVLQFTLTGTFTDGSTQDLTNAASFTTTDVAPAMNVASIDGKALALGKNLGQSTVTATYMARTATTALTVVADSAFCSTDKWCWRNPLPQGQPLRRVWAADATHIWAVGDNGTILKSDGTSWIRQNSGTTNHLHAVWGTDATHIWAVGDYGTILQGNGSTWTTKFSGTGYRLNAVWGLNSNNIWAVGDQGTALAWDGLGWRVLTGLGTANLYGVWGLDSARIWVVGAGIGVRQWNGTSWVSAVRYLDGITLYGIWGTDSSHIWVVGDKVSDRYSVIYMVDGNTGGWISQRATLISQPVYSVWGTDSNHVWAVGAGGLLLKWTGSIWSTQTSGATLDLYGVSGSDSGHIWTVGDGGTLIKGDGAVYTPQNSAVTTKDLSAIWGSDPGHIWAVGGGGTILRSDGSSWRVQSSPTTGALRGIWGSDATHVWAVGAGGLAIQWNGSRWQAQPTGISTSLNAVWGTDAAHIWAVGDGGTILLWDGATWKLQTSGIVVALYGLWGSGASNVWAAGDSGALMRWDGRAWSAESSAGTPGKLTGIWGTAADNIWATGANGALLYFDGSSWTAQTSGTSSALTRVWGTDANHIWIVGENGTTLSGDGSSWTAQNSGATNMLLGVWGTSATHLFAVGQNGTILEKSP